MPSYPYTCPKCGCKSRRKGTPCSKCHLIATTYAQATEACCSPKFQGEPGNQRGHNLDEHRKSQMGNSWILKDKRVMPTDNTELAESATMKGIKLQKIQDYGILLPHDLKDGTPMSFQQGRITAAVRRLGRLKNCAAACCKQGLCDDLCDLLKKGSSAKQKAGFTPHRIIQVITMNSAGAARRADVHFLETVPQLHRAGPV